MKLLNSRQPGQGHGNRDRAGLLEKEEKGNFPQRREATEGLTRGSGINCHDPENVGPLRFCVLSFD